MDRYEERGLDNEQYDPLDLATRNQVDAQLSRRDAEIRRREGRIAGAFLDDLDDDDDQPVLTTRPRRRHNYDMNDMNDLDDAVVRFSISFVNLYI